MPKNASQLGGGRRGESNPGPLPPPRPIHHLNPPSIKQTAVRFPFNQGSARSPQVDGIRMALTQLVSKGLHRPRPHNPKGRMTTRDTMGHSERRKVQAAVFSSTASLKHTHTQQSHPRLENALSSTLKRVFPHPTLIHCFPPVGKQWIRVKHTAPLSRGGEELTVPGRVTFQV